MMAYGTTANLNALDTITKEGLRVANEYETFYEHTAAHLLGTWVILLVFVASFSVLAALVLRNINNERKD